VIKTSEFVPVIDGLTAEMGSLYAAYVYGYIYLHKNADGTFDQPLNTIARRSNLSRSTIVKWVRYLCENGYLADLTPDENARAHTYQITEKAILEVQISFHRVSSFTRGGIRAAERGVSEPRTPGYPSLVPMHDVHDDDAWVSIIDTWEAIGLDRQAVFQGAKDFDDLAEFAALLAEWLRAIDDGAVPEEWGYGLIYKKIRAGEKPPEKTPTFGDEVKAMMELKLKMLGGE
jgi:DNA-binding Lrp family transcriptional regulator